MSARDETRRLWWLIHKDLARELRAPQAWAKMLLLGSVLVLLLATQVDFPSVQHTQAPAGLIWIAIVFAGTLAVESSMMNEQEGGCWETLALYPITARTVFFAKLAVNFASMLLLESVLIPLFIVLTGVPLFRSPLEMILIILLGSIGFAALGTILGALTAGLQRRHGLLALLLLPLLTPLVFGSSEATRIAMSGADDPLLWWWIQLLASFSAVFTFTGAMVFGFLTKE